MRLRRLQLLVLGDDRDARAIVNRLPQKGVEVAIAPARLDIGSLLVESVHTDVVLVVGGAVARGPSAPLHALRDAGMLHRTVFMAAHGDHVSVVEATELGVGGFIRGGTSPQRLRTALDHVARGGIFYDAPAAAVLKGNRRRPRPPEQPAMNAARALAHALELKDTYTGGHAERVTELAMRLARAARLPGAVPGEELEAAFLLHDVGKIGVPESILNKPGHLTDTEWRIIHMHPVLGEQIIAPLSFPECVHDVVRHHHERWDGLGYPDGLAGTQIPAAARVFQIADVFDAMTSIRPYRGAVSFADAAAEIAAGAGSQFDPGLAELAATVFLQSEASLAMTG